MLRRARHRLTTTVLVVLTLLFAQWVLASYVCPAQAQRGEMAQMMAAGEPCQGMDPAQPVLCHQHAADASQSFESPQALVASLPVNVRVLLLPMVPLTAQGAAVWAGMLEDQPPPDPLFLSTGRLRV